MDTRDCGEKHNPGDHPRVVECECVCVCVKKCKGLSPSVVKSTVALSLSHSAAACASFAATPTYLTAGCLVGHKYMINSRAAVWILIRFLFLIAFNMTTFVKTTSSWVMGFRARAMPTRLRQLQQQPLRLFSASTDASSTRSIVKMDDLVNLCKKKGFVFQSSEIYNPMAGFYDYGPLGVELKNNIKRLWWRDMVQKREDMVGLDSSIIASPAIWQASGHVGGFSDPMVDCRTSYMRYRADQVFWAALETESTGEIVTYVSIVESGTMFEDATKAALKKAKALGKTGPFKPLVLKDLTEAPAEIYANIPSPATGLPGSLTMPRDFNLMFQTNVGALQEESSVAYLRPETAQVPPSTSLSLSLSVSEANSAISSHPQTVCIYTYRVSLQTLPTSNVPLGRRFPLVSLRLVKPFAMKLPPVITFSDLVNSNKWKLNISLPRTMRYGLSHIKNGSRPVGNG